MTAISLVSFDAFGLDAFDPDPCGSFTAGSDASHLEGRREGAPRGGVKIA